MIIQDIPQEILDKVNIFDFELFKNYQFAVVIDGLDDHSITTGGYLNATIAGFNRVNGLTGGVNVREVVEIGHYGKHQFPRKQVSETVRLVHGMSFSRALYNWQFEVMNWTKGKPDYRKQVSIFLLDNNNFGVGNIQYEVRRWDLRNAWPERWNGPRLNSTQEKIAFETITLRHEGIVESKSIIGEISSVLN